MKIKVQLNSSSFGKVLIDDIEVPCRGISYHASVGSSPQITLDLVGDIEIEGEADIKLRLPDGRIFTVKEGKCL